MVDINIAAITNGSQGDSNSSLAIRNTIYQGFGGNARVREFKNSTGENIVQEISQKPGSWLVIGAGPKTIPILSQVAANTRKNVQTLWSGNQFYSDLSQAQNHLDFIAIPQYALTESDKRRLDESKLIMTSGIPHQVRKEHLFSSLKSLKTVLPEANNGYLMVSLSGDTEKQDSSIQPYTADEAKSFGKYIGRLAVAENKHVLVTNGPRTGKHCVAERLPNSQALDSVSQAFVEGLREVGCQEIEFFPFVKEDINALRSFMALIIDNPEPKNTLYLPIDSATSLCEIASLITPGANLICYDSSVTSESHKAHAKLLQENGLADFLAHGEAGFELKAKKPVPIASENTADAKIEIQKVVSPRLPRLPMAHNAGGITSSNPIARLPIS